MGDIVTCKGLLVKSPDPSRPGQLWVACPKPDDIRMLPVRPLGEAQKGERPEWQYSERGGRLHIQPSLLCTDSGFHTDFNWDIAYEVLPPGKDPYDYFHEINKH